MRGNGPSVRSLVEALEEPALIVEGGILLVANEAARALLGRSIEGRDVRLAIRHPQALEHIHSGRSAEVEVTGIGEIGRSWRLAVRQLDNRSVLVRLIDRSASVSAERMRVDFVANASHELRTPLSTILGYGETLADEADLPVELRSNFGRIIRDEAQRMLRIIEDLMSLSRIEADRFATPSELVSIGEVVRTGVTNAGLVRGAEQCEFAVDLRKDLPPVRGDYAQLLQVLDNLLTNAVRYGCRTSPCRVWVSAEQDGDWVQLTVTDNGPGIPREHLPRLTERFYRIDTARSRDSGGTGLGLSIVKHIVERHRGTLDIKSTLGEGTSVIVRLPATV
jgi:two-component system phosphate regulon sensor histidine kinase PhoR